MQIHCWVILSHLIQRRSLILWQRVLHLCIVVALLKEYYISVIFFYHKVYYKYICNVSNIMIQVQREKMVYNQRWTINSWAKLWFRRARWVARALELHLSGGVTRPKPHRMRLNSLWARFSPCAPRRLKRNLRQHTGIEPMTTWWLHYDRGPWPKWGESTDQSDICWIESK